MDTGGSTLVQPAPQTRPSSPPPNCAICLGDLCDRCFTNSCMHHFCFQCLVEWSKVKAECPLCKKQFQSIFHNIRSDSDYDEYKVNAFQRLFPSFDASQNIPEFMPHYQFRGTFTVDHREHHAIQRLLMSHALAGLHHNYSGNSFLTSRSLRSSRQTSRVEVETTAFRRVIYHQNLWAYPERDNTVADVRTFSPRYFRTHPEVGRRLHPWLTRELNVLLYNSTQRVNYLTHIILNRLQRHHICSRIFRNLLYEYLGYQTEHFIYELFHFVSSAYSMAEYDRLIVYVEGPPHSRFVPTLDGAATETTPPIVLDEAPLPLPSQQRDTAENTMAPVDIIDLIATDSDEPIVVLETPNFESTTSSSHHNTSNNNSKRRRRPSRRTHSNNTNRTCIVLDSTTSSSSSSTDHSEGEELEEENSQRTKQRRTKPPPSKITNRKRKKNIKNLRSSGMKRRIRYCVTDTSSSDDNVTLSQLRERYKTSAAAVSANYRPKTEFITDAVGEDQRPTPKPSPFLTDPEEVKMEEDDDNVNSAVQDSLATQSTLLANCVFESCPGPSTADFAATSTSSSTLSQPTLWYHRPAYVLSNDSDSDATD